MRCKVPPRRKVSIEQLEQRQLLATFQWLGGQVPAAPYDWNLGQNWLNVEVGSTNQGVPGPDDTAIIQGGPRVELTSDVTVGTLIIGENFRDQNHQVLTQGHTLTFGGGAIDGGWLWGSFVNTGALTVNALTGEQDWPLTITGGLTNTGTIDVQSGTFRTSLLARGSVLPATIVNTTDAAIRIHSGATLGGGYTWVGRIDNQGAILKADGPGTATLAMPVTLATGSELRVEQGTLVLTGNEHRFSGGTVRIAAGATLEAALDLVGGTSTQVTDPLLISGAGTFRVRRGDIQLNSSLSIDGSTFVLESDDLVFYSRISGTGSLEAGTIDIRKGWLYLATLTNRGEVRFSGQGPSESVLHGSTLINEGRLVFDAPSIEIAGSGITNTSTGTIDIVRSGQLHFGVFGGGLSNFREWRNAGLIHQHAGVEGFSINSVQFINEGGTIHVDGGLFDLSGNIGRSYADVSGVTSRDATMIVAPGATLDWHVDGGFHGFGGTFNATGGGTVLLGATGASVADDLILRGDPGMFRLLESTGWYGRIENHTDLTIESPTGTQVHLAGDFVNFGAVRATLLVFLNPIFSAGTGRLFNMPGAVFETAPNVWFLGGGMNSGLSGDDGPLIRNEGLIRLGGAITVDAKLDNLGTIELNGDSLFQGIRSVDLGEGRSGVTGTWVIRQGANFRSNPTFNTIAGTVQLEGPGSQLGAANLVQHVTGSLILGEDAALSMPAHLTNSGRIDLSPGSILRTLQGYSQTTDGSLAISLAAPDRFGRLLSNQPAKLSGGLDIQLAPGFNPGNDLSFEILTASALTGAFTRLTSPQWLPAYTGTAVILGSNTFAGDLVVEDVQLIGVVGPLVPKQPFQIRYTVRNNSNNPVAGPWSDIVHLAQGETRGIDAIFVGVSGNTEILPGQGSTTITLDLVTPAVPGVWNVFVTADRRGVIPDLDRSNNIGQSSQPLTIELPVLTIGAPATITLDRNETYAYELHIPAGTGPFQVTSLFSAIDAGEIRVTRPSAFANGSRSWFGSTLPVLSGRRAEVDLLDGIPGLYHVFVTSRQGGEVTTRADLATLSIQTFDGIHQLHRTLYEGDSLTLTLRGTAFTPDTEFSLGTQKASLVTILDPNTAIVTFTNLQRGGPFAVSAMSGEATAMAPGAPFGVVPMPQGLDPALANWTIFVDMPRFSRPFVEIPVTIRFRNDSPFSQPAPLLSVSTDNGSFRFPSEVYQLGADLGLLGVKPSGRPDRYAPGESGEIRLHLAPATSGNGVTMDVTATVVPERRVTNAGVGQPNGIQLDTIPLPANALDDYRPASMSELAWETVVRPNLESLVGTSMESFADALRNAAGRLSEDHAETSDLNRLMSYLVRVADDFGSISQRFLSSAFGYGVGNPFENRLESDSEGHLVIRSGPSTRQFTRQGSVYVGILEDRATVQVKPTGGWLLTELTGTQHHFRPDGFWDFTLDSAGNRTSGSYAGDRLVSITDEYGDTTTITYDANGNISAVTDPVGRFNRYTYDETGRFLTEIETPTGITSFEYSTATIGPMAHSMTAFTGPDGVRWAYEYDAFGRIARVSRAGGLLPLTLSHESGPRIGVVNVTDPGGATTTIARGEFGQITSVTDALGHTMDYHLDRNGRLNGLRSGDARVSYGFNSAGTIASISSHAGVHVEFGYDGIQPQAVAMVDALGHHTGFTYDASGQLTNWTQPDGATTSFSYDARGRLVERTLENSFETQRTYDSRGFLTRVELPDGSLVDYVRDAQRNVIQVVETSAGGQSSSVSLTYDVAGRITSVTDVNGRVIAYSYGQAGRLARVSADGTSVETAYDLLGRPEVVTRDGTTQLTYTYDVSGNLASRLYGNGTSTVYAYDLLGRVTRIEHRGVDGSLLDFQSYAYDRDGVISALTTPEGTTEYAYDAWGQLVETRLPDGQVRRHDLDALGNRVGFSVDPGNRYLADPAGRTFGYDALGNLIAVNEPDGTSTTYQYDLRNRLIAMDGPAGSVAFEYDPLGNRSAVIRDGVRTELLIDPFGTGTGLPDLMAEYRDGSLHASYLQAAGIQARFDGSGDARYFHHDLVGSTAAVTDPDGEVTASYRYLPFGELISAEGSDAAENALTYHARWGVIAHGGGQYEMRARFYDASTGRFTQPDPIGLGGLDLNLYRFAWNNPVQFIDPSGHQPLGTKINPGTKSPVIPKPVRKVEPPSQPHQPDNDPNRLKPDEFTPSPELDEPEPTRPFKSPFDQLTEDAFLDANRRAPELLPADPGGVSGRDLLIVGGGALAIAGIAGTIVYFSAGSGTPAAAEIIAVSAPVLVRIAPSIARTPAGQRLLLQGTLTAATVISSNSAQAQSRTQQIVPMDPNDITGPGGYGDDLHRQPGGVYPYVIRFQNQPEATAPAQEVFVTQQLDADLNWETFELREFGWADYRFEIPAGRQSYSTRIEDLNRNLIVEITAVFDAATGALSWTFRSLDPISLDLPADALAGFLPPDDEMGQGQGFVSYSIEPGPGAVTGTRYDAQASIVFDTEAAILTNIHSNAIDTSPPMSRVESLPATSLPSFQVRWGGTDKGAGIATYDVWYQVDDGPWEVWFRDTTQTSARFDGLPGRIYGFRSEATDHVGHAELLRAGADAATRVSIPGEIDPPVNPGEPSPVIVPEIVSVRVNGGDTQRSRVTHIDVHFNTTVLIGDSAFRLIRHDGRVVDVLVQSARTVKGQTVATLVFRSPFLQTGSLPDGRYTLVVVPGRIQATDGPAPRAFLAGPPSGAHLVAFHRLFGDVDGNGRIDRQDLAVLRTTLRAQHPSPRFVPAFDINGNQSIDRVDVQHFMRRWGRVVRWPFTGWDRRNHAASISAVVTGRTALRQN